MALRYGADRAATDVTRVLRIPGFANRKYAEPYMVTAERISNRVCRPSDFRIERLHNAVIAQNAVNRAKQTPSSISNSQSERDWQEVCRRLERGDNPADVQGWLEQSRQDKSNPRYYAELTVRRAEKHVEIQQFKKENIMEKHYIEGNTYEVKDDLIKLGCQWDAERKQWYAPDAEIAAQAQAIIDKTPDHEHSEKRYYLMGNSLAVRKELKELGCHGTPKENSGMPQARQSQVAHKPLSTRLRKRNIRANAFTLPANRTPSKTS